MGDDAAEVLGSLSPTVRRRSQKVTAAVVQASMSAGTQSALSADPLTRGRANWLDGPMTRYADPHRCPDCHAVIASGASACGTCALSLRGETAQRLFLTLSQADSLLAVLRAASTPNPTPMPVSVGPTPASLSGGPSGRPTRGRLSAASMPRILLTLGAVCLLVAALVFLAVTWSVMGLGGRTATLAAFTVVAGGLTAAMAQRGLRASAESLALVGYGLLTLDLTGANHAGWFGDLSTSAFLEVLGLVLVLTGAGGALAVRRTAVSRLSGAEVLCAVGTACSAAGLAAWLSIAPTLVAATLVAAAATAATYRLRLVVAATGACVVTATTWVLLTGYALERTVAHADTWAELWHGLQVWPLVVSAAMVAGTALVRRLPSLVRVGALAVAHLLLAVAVLAPAANLPATGATFVALGLLVVTGVATWLLPRPWGLVNLLTQAVTATGVLLVGLLLAASAVARLGEVATPVWSGRAGGVLATERVLDLPSGWLLPLCLVVLVGTLWALAEASPEVVRIVSPAWDLRVGASGLAGSLVLALALYPVPVWLVVGALLAMAVGLVAWWLRTGSVLPLVLAVVPAAVGLVVSLHAEWLTAGALVALLMLSACVHLLGRSSAPAAVGGAVLALTLGGSVWTFGALADVEPAWAALAGLVVLGVLVLGAPYTPARWSACAKPVAARTGLELGAAAAAVPLGLAGVLLAPDAQDSLWAAGYLTAAGVVVTALSLLRADRRVLGWVAGTLLAAASWVRLWDLGVHAPEAYTLPSAVALLVVGLDRLRRYPKVSTMAALAPGLALAPGAEPVAGPHRAGRATVPAARHELPAAGDGRSPARLDRAGRLRCRRRGPARAVAGGAVRRSGCPSLGADRRCRRAAHRGGCDVGATAGRGPAAGELRPRASVASERVTRGLPGSLETPMTPVSVSRHEGHHGSCPLPAPALSANGPAKSVRCDRTDLGESVLVAATLFRNHPGEQVAYFGLAIPAMSAESPDRAQLAGLGPSGDRLRVDSKHGRDLSRGEQRFGLRWPRVHEQASLKVVPTAVPEKPNTCLQCDTAQRKAVV